MKIFSQAGLEIYEFGQDSDRVFYFLPGYCLGPEMYSTTYDQGGVSWVDYLVAKGYMVRVIHWRNFKPKSTSRFDVSVCNAIEEVINSLGKSCTLVTHSLSGRYGWKVLEENNLVDQLIALAPAPPANIDRFKSLEKNDGSYSFESKGFTYHIDEVEGFVPTLEWVEKKLIANSIHFPKEKATDLLNLCNTGNPRALIEIFDVNNQDMYVDLDVIAKKKAKLVIVTGDCDPAHPKETDQLLYNLFEKHISTKFLWLPDYGHTGHGHMFPMESNSTSVLELALKSISK